MVPDALRLGKGKKHTPRGRARGAIGAPGNRAGIQCIIRVVAGEALKYYPDSLHRPREEAADLARAADEGECDAHRAVAAGGGIGE